MHDDIIMGKNAIKEALNNNLTLNKVLLKESIKSDIVIEEILLELKNKKVPFSWVPQKKIDQVCETKKNQGIIAYVSPYNYKSLEDILEVAEQKGEPHFILLLDGVEDPHNLGALIRTAETAGVHGIVIPKHRATGITPTVSKVSAGAISYMKIHRCGNLAQVIETLKEKQIWVYGMEGSGKAYHYQTNLTGHIAIVLGSEGKGLSNNITKNCDEIIKIPMAGQITSLNVSASGAIIMHEILKQKIKNKEVSL